MFPPIRTSSLLLTQPTPFIPRSPLVYPIPPNTPLSPSPHLRRPPTTHERGKCDLIVGHQVLEHEMTSLMV